MSPWWVLCFVIASLGLATLAGLVIRLAREAAELRRGLGEVRDLGHQAAELAAAAGAVRARFESLQGPR